MAPVVSVIIPVFQAEAYLDECVRSVVEQSHHALDIILVDDGSTDGSPRLCDAWALRDARVRVIHQPNEGLSVARNSGLRLATGDFVTFVDADDLVAPDYVAELMEVARSTGADLVLANLVAFDDDQRPHFSPSRAMRRVPAEDALVDIVRTGVGFASCGKLIARHVFDVVRFEPRADFEDLQILPRLFAAASVVATSDAANYGYRQRAGSLMDGHRQVLRPSMFEILSSNIAFAQWSAHARAGEVTAGYVMFALRILEGQGRAGVVRAPGYDGAYRRFMARHIRVVLTSADVSVAYRAAALVSIVSPAAFVRGFRWAARLKSTVAPNLRRRSG
ncbi:hypothetical protein N798_15595 [Knoellia flava TL1]|nr:hypothetical protein N798_15595 [Knoellia flava TL1]